MLYETKLSHSTWQCPGNVDGRRKNPGSHMPVIVCRLLQYTINDVLARKYDDETAGRLYWVTGHLAGKELAKNELDLSGDFDYFTVNLTNKLKELNIGILLIEKVDMNYFSFTLTVSEDFLCSGLPVSGKAVCNYVEGFIAGILETYSGYQFEVTEIGCWTAGVMTCRFMAEIRR